MEREAGSRREAVRQAAALWVVRLDDASCSAADRAAFEAWRDESHEHEAAFEREAAAWARLDRCARFAPGAARPTATCWSRARRLALPALSPRPWARASPPWAVLAWSVAGVTTFGGGTAYATAIGERRVVVLSDNSRIELNTNSKVVVRYRKGVREIKLIRGEAVFEAAKDDRPFVIKAEGAIMEPGDATEMAVRLGVSGAMVTVRKGSVELDPNPAWVTTNFA
jgi:transmembrane sensor